MAPRLLLVLFGAMLFPPLAPITVFVADPLTRIRPKDAPRATKEARLKAARNEYECFQVVVRAGEGGLKEVTAEASDLKGEGERAIDRKHVAIYREHYLDVKTPTVKSKEGPGLYPDALIPLTVPKPTAPPVPGAPPPKPPRFVGAPFALPADLSQPLWVEVYVPKETAPGEYSGTITVSAAGQRPATVPVTITVWDFTLPDNPSLRTNFGGLGRRLLTGHSGYKPDTVPYRALERRYAESMAAHRLCPPIPPYVRPKVGPDGTIDPKETHAALKEWIESFHVTGLPLSLLGEDPTGKDRDKNVKFLQSSWAYLKENGWEKLAYIYVIDEPNDPKAYEEIRKRAKMIHEVVPGLKVLCTEQPVAQDPSWGTLVGSVDIWVPLWPLFDEKSIAERQKAGEEVWSYTALCQGKPGEDTPFWQLDFPLLNYRIPAWTSRRYGLTGLLYWTVVFWPAGDTWMNPLTYKTFNGEGALFYPGADVGIDGPVASMRLKSLRDGLEDYEYLVLAGDAGAAKAAAVAASWTKWETDPAKLAEAREELAKAILEKKK
jgi:hypothetical protein